MALEILVHTSVPTMIYSLLLVGLLSKDTVREVEPLAVILDIWPSPAPFVMITYPLELDQRLVSHAFVLSLITAVEPGVPEEQMPRSPLIRMRFSPSSARLSTAYSAPSISKKCHLRGMRLPLSRKKKLIVDADQALDHVP